MPNGTSGYAKAPNSGHQWLAMGILHVFHSRTGGSVGPIVLLAILWLGVRWLGRKIGVRNTVAICSACVLAMTVFVGREYNAHRQFEAYLTAHNLQDDIIPIRRNARPTSRLERVVFCDTATTKTVEEVLQMPGVDSVESISIRYSEIDDDELQMIASMTNVRFMAISSNTITADGVYEFSETRPDCTISYSNDDGDFWLDGAMR